MQRFVINTSLTGWRMVITPLRGGRVKQLGLSVYLSVCVCLSVQQSNLQEVIAKPTVGFS